MSLIIENSIDTLEITDIDKWDEVIFYTNSLSGGTRIYINHQDATKIINHLKNQFQL